MCVLGLIVLTFSCDGKRTSGKIGGRARGGLKVSEPSEFSGSSELFAASEFSEYHELADFLGPAKFFEPRESAGEGIFHRDEGLGNNRFAPAEILSASANTTCRIRRETTETTCRGRFIYSPESFWGRSVHSPESLRTAENTGCEQQTTENIREAGKGCRTQYLMHCSDRGRFYSNPCTFPRHVLSAGLVSYSRSDSVPDYQSHQ